MSRLTALLLVLALWAAIYLPGLGSTELRGEEARRILPAVTMLETGDWLVPRLSGKPYLRKPPLINWVIAASFKITGVQNEWTARLPSAFAVLALGLCLAALGGGRDWLTLEQSVAAAALAMLSFGLLAKARFVGAEIEGVFVPLSQIGIVTWLAGWAQRRSPWFTWIVPFLFLGLACLAKGPNLHLVVFYLVVLVALWRAGELRALFQPAHLVGLAVGAGIFAAWAWPFYHLPETRDAMEVLRRQGISRFTESEVSGGNYALNLPRGLADALPALLLAPAIVTAFRQQWRGVAEDQRRAAIVIACVIAFAITFALLLVPGMLPRYVLPAGVLLALAAATTREWTWLRGARAWQVVGGFALLSVIYALAIVPLMERRAKLRPFAAQIDAAVPAGATLIVCDPEDDASRLGAMFYLHSAHRYAGRVSEIPVDARWVLVHAKKAKKLPEARPEFVSAQTFLKGSGSEWVLFRRKS